VGTLVYACVPVCVCVVVCVCLSVCVYVCVPVCVCVDTIWWPWSWAGLCAGSKAGPVRWHAARSCRRLPFKRSRLLGL